MANQADLERLKLGVTVWNQWRAAYPGIQPDLSQADLIGADLREVDLHGANLVWTRLGGAMLNGANLSQADLTGADLGDTDLRSVNLSQANLSRANLIAADLRLAKLSQANLRRTDLMGVNLVGATLCRASLDETDLSEADLSETDLRSAHLLGTNLSEVDLVRANLGWTTLRETMMRGTNFSQARLCYTVFANVDLSVAQGLEEVNHFGPSTLGIDTLYRCQGLLPEAFLRGAGVPPLVIPSASSMPNTYETCLISYAHHDQAFAEQLCADLQRKGVRCWLVPKGHASGASNQNDMEEPLRRYDQLLLVLSEHSVQSVWIEKEVQAAFERETQQAKRVIFPILLDHTVRQTRVTWATDLCWQRPMGDFCAWKQHEHYLEAFDRLYSDLNKQRQKHGKES